jgi:surfactin synthase thioesterase subunit
MALAMPALRADFEAMENWSYESAPPLDIPLTALRDLDDPALRAE